LTFGARRAAFIFFSLGVDVIYGSAGVRKDYFSTPSFCWFLITMIAFDFGAQEFSKMFVDLMKL